METRGTQDRCQFLRELELDSIDSIRLLLGKEESSGPLNLLGRPDGRLPELGISKPMPRGTYCLCSESPLHVIRRCLFSKVIILVGMSLTFPPPTALPPVLTEQALILSSPAEAELSVLCAKALLAKTTQGENPPASPPPSIPSTSHTHTLSTLLLTRFHTLSTVTTTPTPPPVQVPPPTRRSRRRFTAVLSKCAHCFIHTCEARAGIPVHHIRKLGHPDRSSYPDRDW